MIQRSIELEVWSAELENVRIEKTFLFGKSVELACAGCSALDLERLHGLCDGFSCYLTVTTLIVMSHILDGEENKPPFIKGVETFP